MHRLAVTLLAVAGFAVLPQALGADAEAVALMTQPLGDVPNKEVLMLTVMVKNKGAPPTVPVK